ncbi:hypothetical protein COU75_00785 [Candidatus Peregrinibacteria bacterium CG10_big_fil_rev_8_21_14_0_10_42_8]|nr:MAG: hypothetical protein COU75_00785 [Candidatus Peregrinibacteria bacterium CG10_big_fil_rev_8_21_14_0_10_42_8]
MRFRLFVAIFSSVLTGCSTTSSAVQPLSSDVVLAKAAKATHTLESAKYILTGNINAKNSDLWSTDATMRMDGILHDAGEQMRFQLDTDAVVQTPEDDYELDATLEVVVASKDEVYMNLHSLVVQPPNPLLRPDLVGKLASKWWLLPQNDSLPVTSQVTPDPRLLQAQSQVVRITKDNGIIEMNGSQLYHYNVELDKEKLLAYLQKASLGDAAVDTVQLSRSLEGVTAKGELWIDAETYYVHKLQWNIKEYPIQVGGMADIQFTVTFTDHNNAPDILLPLNAKEFSPYELLSPPELDFTNDSILDTNLDLDDEAINSLLRSMDSY